MKKKWLVTLLAAGCIAMLAGCQRNKNGAEPTGAPAEETPVPTEEATAAPEPTRVVVPARTDYLTEEDMQTASPWKVCDNTALAAAMKKAEAGEPVTIAVLGGSITQGTISSGAKDSQLKTKNCYAEIFFAWWRETFPNSKVTVVNAGIGATDSYLGVHRVQEDVLDFHPDVVLIEYSVNDAGTNTYKNTYDNLVYKVATSEDAPAVLLLFMGQTNLSSAVISCSRILIKLAKNVSTTKQNAIPVRISFSEVISLVLFTVYPAISRLPPLNVTESSSATVSTLPTSQISSIWLITRAVIPSASRHVPSAQKANSPQDKRRSNRMSNTTFFLIHSCCL